MNVKNIMVLSLLAGILLYLFGGMTTLLAVGLFLGGTLLLAIALVLLGGDLLGLDE